MIHLRLFRFASILFASGLLAGVLVHASHAQQEAPPADAVQPEQGAIAETPAEEPTAEEPAEQQASSEQADSPADPRQAKPSPPVAPLPEQVPASESTEKPAEPEAPKPEVNKPEPKPKKPQPKELTATTLAEVDNDFAYQGEYAASSAVGFGLQVIALGDGKFDAVLYPGGLPGAGWAGGTKYEYSGELDGEMIFFAGEPYSLKVRGNYAELLRGGTHAGFLPKTNRSSSTMHARAPYGAKILFDGTSTDAFEKGKLTEQGWLAAGTSTKAKVRDFRMHLEFRLPYKPNARGQGRGNSGVYIQRRYEVQVLDSFGLEGKPNECGGLYRQKAPDVNMCLPPLSWQTYDIYFRAARFDEEGKKTENAKITVLHNGYPIHSGYELTNKTGAGRQETEAPGEIYLQDHGNPVAFRNIWLIEGDQLSPLDSVQQEPAASQPCYPRKHRCRLFRRR